ncbi:hypothetical protein SETIT_5G123800v2 [Setaria italica]|uniref:Uncharacterized protein n=1 Tax=Setaria italica TaxID=4555 RepID=A0A368R3X8_SETIT|nr:hypothetical protein SETIT_5G123800v2 [Setaria italica]
MMPVERRLFSPPEGVASIKCLSLLPKVRFNWASRKNSWQRDIQHLLPILHHKVLPNSFRAVASFLPTLFLSEMLKQQTLKYIRIQNRSVFTCSLPLLSSAKTQMQPTGSRKIQLKVNMLRL